MEETKKENLETKLSQEEEKKKIREKKNTFTLIYILVGMFMIAVILMLLYAFFMIG